jgi:hypothetical protein
MISDGEDSAFLTLPPQVRESREEALVKLIDTITKGGSTISAIAVGSEEGGVIPQLTQNKKVVVSKMDPTLLALIAGEGKGQFFEAKRYSVKELVSELTSEVTTFNNSVEEELRSRHDAPQVIYTPLFQFPLFFGILFFSLALLLNPTVSCRASKPA